jgi:hypothetical protein
MNIAVLVVDGRDYDKTIEDAKESLAKAATLRERADLLQSEDQI